MAACAYNQEALANLKIEDTSVLDRLVDFSSTRAAHLKKDHSQRDKRMSLSEAVAECLQDGDIATDTGFELLRPEGEIPVTPAPSPEVLAILRSQVDPNGVFTSIPGM
jgi:hypothetical protein